MFRHNFTPILNFYSILLTSIALLINLRYEFIPAKRAGISFASICILILFLFVPNFMANFSSFGIWLISGFSASKTNFGFSQTISIIALFFSNFSTNMFFGFIEFLPNHPVLTFTGVFSLCLINTRYPQNGQRILSFICSSFTCFWQFKHLKDILSPKSFACGRFWKICAAGNSASALSADPYTCSHPFQCSPFAEGACLLLFLNSFYGSDCFFCSRAVPCAKSSSSPDFFSQNYHPTIFSILSLFLQPILLLFLFLQK